MGGIWFSGRSDRLRINNLFHEFKLADGISRLILPGAKPALNRSKRRERRARAEPEAAARHGTESQDRLDNGQRLSPRGPMTENG